MAEGLGTGLQNLLLRFKSGSDLKDDRLGNVIAEPVIFMNIRYSPDSTPKGKADVMDAGEVAKWKAFFLMWV